MFGKQKKVEIFEFSHSYLDLDENIYNIYLKEALGQGGF